METNHDILAESKTEEECEKQGEESNEITITINGILLLIYLSLLH